MVLGLLPVVREAGINAMLRVESSRHARCERDALVGGAENRVESEAGGSDAGCVCRTELGLRPACAEKARIEEEGRAATRLQGELAEAEHLQVQRHVDEVPLEGLQGRCRRCTGGGRGGLRLLSADGVDRISKAHGCRCWVRRGGDAAGDRQQESVAIVGDGSTATRLEISSLGTDSWRQEPSTGVHPAYGFDGGDVRGADDQAHVVVAIPMLARNRKLRDALEDATTVSNGLQRLDVGGGGVRCLAQDKGTLFRTVALRHRWVNKWRERIPTHVRREGDGVGS
mmetsp:Transcript_11431/g.23992  ORF Transcript_11431/g.23992 Transcript_11431/m.23992 type:complete len:284 (-) Transcript_11431:412-1263(-)